MKLLTIILGLLLSHQVLSFDHSHKAFNDLLKKHVIVEGNQSLVNYQGFKEDSKKLDDYLKELSDAKLTSYKKWRQSKKLSFLINAYNAFTVKLIIDNYPVKSIKDLGGFFSSPWKKEFVPLFGKTIHLDEIEHGMIRKQFDEPRIHFAVNCASIGCPSLLNEAFQFDKLEDQLERATKNFLTNKSKNKVENGKGEFSKIFKWYGDDFNNKYKSFRNFIATKLLSYGQINQDTAEKLKSNKLDYDWTSYDWNLNDKKQ